MGGTLKTLTSVKANVSGTLKLLSTIHANVSGTLKPIFSALPSNISGSCTPPIQTAPTIAENIVIPASCTVTGKITTNDSGNGGPVIMQLWSDDTNYISIISDGWGVNSMTREFTGSATVPAGTYSLKITAFIANGSSSGVTYKQVGITYSLVFS